MKKNIILSIYALMTTISVYASEPSKVELLKRIQQLEEQVTVCNKTKEEKYITPFRKLKDESNNLENNLEKNFDSLQSYKSDVPIWLLR